MLAIVVIKFVVLGAHHFGQLIQIRRQINSPKVYSHFVAQTLLKTNHKETRQHTVIYTRCNLGLQLVYHTGVRCSNMS